MKRIAVIVIGSNSTKLLAADACAALSNTSRGRAETRLFLGMSQNGRFSEEAMQYTVDAVYDLAKKAQSENAELTGIYATSASRDAKNTDELSRMLKEKTGFPLTVLSGEQEATYSFLGASQGARCGVIDIGGGSTEVVLGESESIHHAQSLQLGASRLFKAQPIHSVDDIPRALQLAKEKVHSLPAQLLKHEGFDHFYLIGGTCTTLAALAGVSAEGFEVTWPSVHDTLYQIASIPREQRAEIPGMPATRVDILPTGLAILLTLMDELGIASATVTKRVNADGLLHEYVHKKFA